MYFNYGIVVGADQPNCVRSGDYNGIASPYQSAEQQTGNFTDMRHHAQRERILEIDDQFFAATEECKALSGSLHNTSEAVKMYVQTRICELKSSVTALELERSRLLAIAM